MHIVYTYACNIQCNTQWCGVNLTSSKRAANRKLAFHPDGSLGGLAESQRAAFKDLENTLLTEAFEEAPSKTRFALFRYRVIFVESFWVRG